MPIIGMEIRRGVKVPAVDGVVQSAEFAVTFIPGAEGDIDTVRRDAANLADEAVGEFLDTIRPDNVAPTKESSLFHDSPKQELPMVELIFDAADSKHRSDRIMRAQTEEMTFEPCPTGDGWICTDHNERQFRVNADKAAGAGRCDCEDFVHRGSSQRMPCKHIYALVLNAAGFWGGSESKIS
jgi:hypothetical protein